MVLTRVYTAARIVSSDIDAYSFLRRMHQEGERQASKIFVRQFPLPRIEGFHPQGTVASPARLPDPCGSLLMLEVRRRWQHPGCKALEGPDGLPTFSRTPMPHFVEWVPIKPLYGPESAFGRLCRCRRPMRT